jgi:hypothetical protein
VAVTATARKLVVIAYLMLKHNEPYRYAKPELVHRKLARIRKTTGKPAVKPSERMTELCEREGLPRVTAFAELPVGERRVLRESGAEAFAQRVLSEGERPPSL